MNYFNPADFYASLPLIILLATGLILMLADAFKAKASLPWIAGVGLILSSLFSIPGWTAASAYTLHYNYMIAFGGMAALIHVFLCASGLFSIFFIGDFFRRHNKDLGDVYALLIFAVMGMIMLANGNDLIIVFIGLEVMSVCLYIMAAAFKRDLKSNEAGMKYFLLGAFATGFLLYGIALVYAMTASTRLDFIATIVPDPKIGASMADNPLFYPAFGLILIGFLFKIAAFPFHSWTPDVYTGTPTPLAGFMASGSKMAAFFALSTFMAKMLPMHDPKVLSLVGLLAVASMVYGNIVAARQNNLKRMLAYSSIAHTGYLLLGICAGPEGYQAVMFYMVIYTLMTIGAFGIIAMVETTDDDADIERWKGLGLQRPWLGVFMSMFLFSLAGMPPLAGFMGKYQVFLSAIDANLVWLAVIGVLTSVIGAYYYIRVIVYMYFYKTDGAPALAAPAGAVQLTPMIGAIVLAILLVLLGVYPWSILNYMDTFFQGMGTAAQALR
jgi:NADH-quinone oxidoreductase subunit N